MGVVILNNEIEAPLCSGAFIVYKFIKAGSGVRDGVDWSRYEEDGSSYYLVIPEELNVKDTINNIIPYTLVEDHVQLLGHYYKILESQAPWYEFTYTIYKPFEHE